MSKSALEGVRVIEFTIVWAGPWAGAVLSDMGAEVIKIESRKRLDHVRYMLPYAPYEGGDPGLNRSAFNFINRGKKGCTLNLKQPKAVEIAKKIVAISDVVIENFSPSVMGSFGLDYAALKAVKPDIIMVSLPGLGGTGPDKDHVCYASTVEGIGGLTSSTGYLDGEPEPSSIYPADPLGGLYGVIAILSALYHRYETGKGQHIDISQSEAVISIIPEAIMEYTMNAKIRPRMGNRDDIMAPHGCYRCKGYDKWVSIAVSTDEEWKALCKAMGNPDWSKEDRFSDAFSRWQNQDELDKMISEWTKEHSPYEVMQILQKVGVAAGPTFNIEELIEDAQIKERGFFVEQNHPEAGRTIVNRSPFRLSETDVQVGGPAPVFGEHNGYVFKELLGISDEEITKLVEQEVIY
jgi:benzylsuccinate CoA-transferase BbsF subunit